eukprot:TRINITY_DN17112_c0_g1_i1.p1 TRINITY_DN17112_c0_g1~~TRINITY_DN17112_c0_g1_i1.p1  ORF type:complete len:488 (+),score=108.99 TRINITY_DN17112_c0_g1_i1:39-1466(+)
MLNEDKAPNCMQRDTTALDDVLCCDTPFGCSMGEPRWARKERERAQQQTPAKTAVQQNPDVKAARQQGDRFIAQQQTPRECEASHQALLRGELAKENRNDVVTCCSTPECKILSFSRKAPEPTVHVLSTCCKAAVPRKASRYIAQTPYKVLDAPELVDDFYANVLDWGGASAGGLLAVGLGPAVYVWTPATGRTTELMCLPHHEAPVTSVRWISGAAGSYLAVGTNTGEVQLWDVAARRQQRSLRGHAARVSALAWCMWCLASGSRDASVILHDVRVRQHCVASLFRHALEVCGLEWSEDGRQQLASGGNDNAVCVWDQASTAAPRLELTRHRAAVKAIAWCPWQAHLLASGGGTADQTVRLWDTQTGACVNVVNTYSQVTSLQWSTSYKELVTSHGFSDNQLSVWRCPTMEKLADLRSHQQRILCTARSPCGEYVVSAGADETLRFWHVWPQHKAAVAEADAQQKQKNGSYVIR